MKRPPNILTIMAGQRAATTSTTVTQASARFPFVPAEPPDTPRKY